MQGSTLGVAPFAVALAAAIALGCGSEPVVPAPSLLMIVSDTLRADALSCYGGPARTPHLCALAERGVLLEHTYSPSPWTLPSSVGMLTGSSPAAFGTAQRQVTGLGAQDFYFIPHDEWLLSESLRAQGYDVRYDFENGVAARSNALQAFDPFETPDGDARERIREEFGLVGRDYRYKKLYGVLHALRRAGVGEGRSRPFFYFKWFNDSHSPYDPPAGFREDVVASGKGLPRGADFYPRIDIRLQEDVPRLRDIGPTLEEREVAYLVRLYHAEIESVDDRVGLILDALEESGRRDETFIVFTSDHGEGFGEHGKFGHSTTIHEEMVRVPFIVAGPGLLQGARISEPVSLIDMMPTLIDLLDTDALPDAQGQSLAALLRGEPGAGPPTVPLLVNPGPRNSATYGVVAGGFKLIRWNDGRIELFDLESDPGERENLASQQPSRVAKLGELIAARERDDRRRRAANARASSDEERIRVGEETIEQLRALGYLEDD